MTSNYTTTTTNNNNNNNNTNNNNNSNNNNKNSNDNNNSNNRCPGCAARLPGRPRRGREHGLHRALQVHIYVI